jgi:hypothetical protein
MPAYSPAEITPAPSPQPSASPSQQAVAQLDPRLIGKWETGSNAPENLRKVRWEQFADGHYVFSGPISDNGVITGGDDGKFQQFSNAANQPVQVSYEFKGDKLVTNGPLGQAEWRRTGSTTSSKRQSTNTNQSTPRRGYKVRDDDIRNNVLKRVLRRFP